MSKLAPVAVLLLMFPGCHEDPDYCPGALKNNCNLIDAPGAQGCTSDPQCSGDTAVCDTASMTCVQCTTAEPAACTGTTPVCGSDETCHACTQHGECASNVCLPDGSCSDGSNVAYVDQAGTDNTMCTKAMHCTKISSALATGRPYLKITGTITEAISLQNKNVTFLADTGAKLTESTAGIVLEVKGTSQVVVHDLTISDGLSTGIGVSMPTGNTATLTLDHVKLLANSGGGATVSAGTLTVTQSTVSGNSGGGVTVSSGTLTVTQSTVSGNAGGGLSISNAQFTLVNNMIASNGAGTSGLGGVKIDGITTSGTHQLDFNTITANLGPATVDTGVQCGTVTVPLAFKNNIIYANIVASGGVQIGGSANCVTSYSDIGPDTVSGQGNINMDPMFVSTGQANFHIQSSSPCKDVADPGATLAVDFDGDTRPQGAGRDLGADEYKP